MDNLTDIESIILSQNWKKSKTTVGSPQPRSPLHGSKQKQSPLFFQNFSISYENSPREAPKIAGSSTDNKGRVIELAKLAVPYRALTEAINLNLTPRSEPTLVPAFPMRKFGFSNRIEPIFEKLSAAGTTSNKEIFYIKKKSGRTISNKTGKLPSIFSPRGSKMSFIGSPKLKSKELFEYNKEDCGKIPEDLVLNLVRTLSNISDHNKPYLDELDYSQQSDSFYSLDSSLLNDEISIINEVSDIKLKMSEMKMIARDSIKSFKRTSKEFLAQSILESEKRTLLLDELENLKTTLVERIREGNDVVIADVSVKDICEQVHDVQAQIKACIEGDHQDRLAAKLRDLDSSLELIVCEKENRSDGCQCLMY